MSGVARFGALYGALLDDRTVVAKHPAVRCGVGQSVDCARGRINVELNVVNLALASGSFVRFPSDDIATVERAERTVGEETREVLEVEHADEGQSVVT